MAKIGQAGTGMFLMTLILTSAIKKDTLFIHFPCSFYCFFMILVHVSMRSYRH